MSIVKVDSSNPDNFRAKKLADPGNYCFVVENEPVVAQAKSSQNQVVNVEVRITDDGKFKGSKIYATHALTAKAEWMLCHLVLSCGTQSEEEIARDGIDLGLLKGETFEAEIGISDPQTDPSTGQKYKPKNTIEKYLFEPEGEEGDQGQTPEYGAVAAEAVDGGAVA